MIAAMQRAHAKWMALRGSQVTFRRTTGFAPNATTASAVVNAIVLNLMPDPMAAARTGYPESQTGALMQNSHKVIVMAADLTAAGFTPPVKQNDTILVSPVLRLNVEWVDDQVRSVAGAIECMASGS